jgi:hypothetical protein
MEGLYLINTNNKVQNAKDAESWFQILFNKYFDKRSASENFTKTFPVIVKNVYNGGTSVDVVMPDDLNNIIPNVKVRVGVTLKVGSTVYATALNRNMSNIFIDMNFGS